ncbi:hypothetical protein EVAR_60333_1 [Eumeta japonica]|uniref:Uncharacterized protein n=1 Tax=Eumeta variegata TaxID=151549 RepID=A0A4C1Z960_EUMVA|nr:hypothetical protein EVAR_60333_1 [Eumeta japonica]
MFYYQQICEHEIQPRRRVAFHRNVTKPTTPTSTNNSSHLPEYHDLASPAQTRAFGRARRSPRARSLIATRSELRIHYKVPQFRFRIYTPSPGTVRHIPPFHICMLLLVFSFARARGSGAAHVTPRPP